MNKIRNYSEKPTQKRKIFENNIIQLKVKIEIKSKFSTNHNTTNIKNNKLNPQNNLNLSPISKLQEINTKIFTPIFQNKIKNNHIGDYSKKPKCNKVTVNSAIIDKIKHNNVENIKQPQSSISKNNKKPQEKSSNKECTSNFSKDSQTNTKSKKLLSVNQEILIKNDLNSVEKNKKIETKDREDTINNFTYFKTKKIDYKNYGLHNLGNTCYMNSVLQILLNTEEFIQNLKSDGEDLGIALYDLYLNRDATNKIDFLREFVIKLGKKDTNQIWLQGNQMDSKEFYLFILNNLNIKTKQIFKGLKNITYKPQQNCRNTLNSSQQFCIINAGFHNIDNYFKNELSKFIDKGKAGEHNFFCELCDFDHLFDEYVDTNIPQIICIYFDNSIPQNFNVKKYKEFKTKDYRLRLIGIIQRRGYYSNSGHATAYYFFPDESAYLFDDLNVTPFSLEEIYSPYMIFFKVLI